MSQKNPQPFRYLDRITRMVVQSWISMEQPKPIPWTPLRKPLSACTVALISTGGIALKSDTPFDQEGEKENPWWGDPSYRVLPRTTTRDDIEVYHLHVNPVYVKEDLNCLLPLERLQELANRGEIGQSAVSHYSFMGYQLDPTPLLCETTPRIIEQMREEGVDLVVLVPA